MSEITTSEIKTVTLQQLCKELARALMTLVCIAADDDTSFAVEDEVVHHFAELLEEFVTVLADAPTPSSEEMPRPYVIGYAIQESREEGLGAERMWKTPPLPDVESARSLFCRTFPSSLERRYILRWVVAI